MSEVEWCESFFGYLRLAQTVGFDGLRFPETFVITKQPKTEPHLETSTLGLAFQVLARSTTRVMIFSKPSKDRRVASKWVIEGVWYSGSSDIVPS